MAQKVSCCEYFVTKQKWMVLGYNKMERTGDLICPTSTCRTKVGVYALEKYDAN